MFGYVRPLRAELKCRDDALYHAYYCGLCRTMRRRCGWLSALALNYDFTFLAILLSAGGEAEIGPCRCPVPPFRRKCACAQSAALELAADESVILTYWQLDDTIRDASFWPGLGARIARLGLRRAYRRAADRRPAFADAVRLRLDQLHRLEAERCSAVDPPADAFASILRSALPVTGEDTFDRPMAQLLYHLGRWIYLIDARDDVGEDERRGNYNPVLLRYTAEERDEALGRTLDQSVFQMRAAAALLEFGRARELVENVITLGIPAVQRDVFSGAWRQRKKQRWENVAYE